MLKKSLLEKFEELETLYEKKYKKKFIINTNISRKIVSFQGNKLEPKFRWFKYKEAFSKEMVKYIMKEFSMSSGTIFDPFSGIGTTLFSGSEERVNTEGIELLPVGQEIINIRKYVEFNISEIELEKIKFWKNFKPWIHTNSKISINELRITKGAYPIETQEHIEKFLYKLKEEDPNVGKLLKFVLMCVLEDISYTRKDGQYLRWDSRAPKKEGKGKFKKPKIYNFLEAIDLKFQEIIEDIQEHLYLNKEKSFFGNIQLYKGSSIEIMPSLNENKYSGIITSPPYCNRYDYTRTYALEHALLGVNEKQIVNLRQCMLSCTVENKEKELLSINKKWEKTIKFCDEFDLLQSILNYLEYCKENKLLNNNGIARMVKGYFYEMAVIIYESYRVLEKNKYLVMVNDNVRYAGISIPVDIILSEIAKNIGFKIEKIYLLPKGKGNSSQQMGEHGRKELRKCIYIWRKK